MKRRQYPKRKSDLTHDLLLKLLSYDPETGQFHWREYRQGTSKDRLAGTMGLQGYWQVFICGKIYRSHRLAWFYVQGKWPENLIDHVDGDKANNRMANLREATHAQNSQFYHTLREDRRLDWKVLPQFHC